MENILYDFNKKITSLVENYLKNLLFTKGISEFTEDLVKEFAEFGSSLTQYLIDVTEKTIFELKERKEDFESLEKDERTVISIFGEVNFKRRYYLDKEKNEKVYLLDKVLKIIPKERLLENVQEKLISEAVVTSYENAGEKAAYNTKISRQEVKNEIEKLDLTKDFYEETKDKKKIEYLYIIADEDHVHLQKGGIEEPRIVIVYENAISTGKRIELKNKRHFGGLYKHKIDDLWEEVASYIEGNYDIDYLKKVFIQGDGASWIKTGKEWILKSEYVLDEFHMTKAVNAIVGRITKENKKEQIENKRKLYYSIKKFDFKGFKENCYDILSEEMDKTLRKRKEQNMNYILNNIEGIRNLYQNQELLHGCSAEGHVSHIYSDRMSSRPMGWKSENINNMSKLRLLKEDNVSVKEILSKQGKVIDFEEYREIREKTKKKINKNIDFKPVQIPIMEFGTHEQKEMFRAILREKVAI